MPTPVRVGDEFKFSGKVIEAPDADYVRIHFSGGDGRPDYWVHAAILAAAERLPRKLAVGDRVEAAGYMPGMVIKYIGGRAQALVEWPDGSIALLPLSDLRLSDDGEGK